MRFQGGCSESSSDLEEGADDEQVMSSNGLKSSSDSHTVHQNDRIKNYREQIAQIKKLISGTSTVKGTGTNPGKKAEKKRKIS